MKHTPLTIALDADGVLLDYNLAWGTLWQQAYGRPLECVEPNAYHATTYWGVEMPDQSHDFWALFDHCGWRNMPAKPGAVEACQRMASAGHRLVCVTSMPVHHQHTRLANLKDLGFPIEQVIATGAGRKGENPKREAIERLAPDWFVDDELRKLKDLARVKCALIDPGHPDSPNHGHDDTFIQFRVPTLLEFADRLLGQTQTNLGAPISPCVNVCELNEGKMCVGCGRSLEEITSWSTLSDPERLEIMKVLPTRQL